MYTIIHFSLLTAENLEGIVKPVQDSLLRLDKEIREIEKERIGSYTEIKSQIESLSQLEKELRQETGNLVKALRQPIGRGQWGEVVLEKVLEISGMVEGIHYDKQVSVSADDGIKRPDIIVNLPGEKKIIIDAKAVMNAYLDLMNSDNEEERDEAGKEHAKQVKSRINDLSKKEYEKLAGKEQLAFVVLFLPAESLFSTALRHDNGLLVDAAQKNIILATPTTLIALLRTVYYGWKQYEIAKNAEEIGKIGSELHNRFGTMIKHFNNLGISIKRTGEAFDKTAGSFNAMLRPSFNKLRAKVAQEQSELNEIEALDITPRSFSDLNQD
ncbi:MAG: DNA recombination protein RmuC [Snowella sp.]|nr:DNA recombination protein RmuC [Snowella sp.]